MKENKYHQLLSPVIISSLAFFLLIYIPNVSNTLSCSWEGQVTPVSSLFSNSTFLSNTDAVLQINDVVETLEVYNLMPSDTQNISAYGYYIIARVRCVDDDSSSVGRALFSRGGGVIITISNPSETVTGDHVTHKDISLVGAPVEMDQSCSSVVCDPGWVTPLPTSQDHHLMKVHISTRGGYHGVQSSQYTLHVDGYWREFTSDNSPLSAISKLINNESIQDHLLSVNPMIVYYLSPLISPMFLPSTDRGLIFSSNYFKDNVFLQVTPVTATRVCEEEDGASFVVTLPDRILYGDSLAAFEIFGKFAVVSQQNVDFRPIDVACCIKRIIVPPHSYLVDWFIYVIGSDEADTDQIYQAIFHTDEPLEFLEVTDVEDSGLCEFITGGNEDISCSVIDGAVSATTPNEAFLLVQMPAAECNMHSGVCYIVLQLIGLFNTRTWRSVAMLPQDNCTMMNSDLCRIETPLNLTGVTTTARPSKHIFLWGSSLIHSPDEGVTWHQVVGYDSSEITILTTSANGQIVVLNKNQEVWYGFYGPTVSLTKLRPSTGWQLNEALATGEFNQVVKTISVYFDSYYSLREIIITENESDGKLSISSRIIPAARIIRLERESAPLREGLTMATSDAGSPSCPFSGLLVVATLDQSAEKQEYYELGPPSLTQSELHDENSLLVYQGLLYLILDLRQSGRMMSYAGDVHNPTEQWLESKLPLEAYHEYLYRNCLLQHSIHVTLQSFQNGSIQVKEGRVFSLPAEVFLDKGDSYQFKIQLKGWTQGEQQEADLVGLYHNLDLIQLMVEVSHLDLLQVDLSRRVDYLKDTVEYTVSVEDLAIIGHKAPPGRLLQASSFTLEAWDAALNCFEEIDDHETKTKGLLEMKVFHGCPPGRVLQYDINATILYNGINRVYDCPQVDPKLPCVYFKHDFHPLFEVLDMTTGKSVPFTEPYTLKVIGGQGTQEAQMQYFTAEEVAKYNWIDSNTLIWVPLRASDTEDTAPIFDRTNNGLAWRCKQFSPCSDRPLTFPWMPEYKFLVEVSNIDIESASSYCEYTMQFMVKVHGLPISALRSIRIVAWCLLLSCCIIALFLICDWNDRWVWTRTKLWVRNGFRVHPNLGSREWSIHRSADGSEISLAGTFVTTKQNLDNSKKAEITWNIAGSWTAESKPSNPLDQINEEAESEIL